MDFPTSDELIANKMSVDEIKDYLDVDSLHYLSLKGMLDATGMDHSNFCTACFSGDYPIKVDKLTNKQSFE